VSRRPGPRTAIVLAGGGFKAAFELGAFRHLAEHHDVVPDVITATSAGAILGTVAAQARTPAELLHRLDEADGDLMAMTQIDVVFGEQPWLRELDGTEAAERIRALITGGAPDSSGNDEGHHPFRDAIEVARRLPRAHSASSDPRDRGILNLDPFEAALRGKTDVGVASLDPVCVARDGLDLRLATTHYKARATHYVTGNAELLDSDARTPVADAGHFDLIDGLIASASVPGVFPARRLGSSEYVDGGVLANIPLAAAAALDPGRIFTLAASPVREPAHRAVAQAAEGLGYLATQVHNLAVPLPDGCTNTLIQPSMLVVDTFEVHPGRMRIDIDYGWLRAQETVADLDEGAGPILSAATDTIIGLRQQAWALEKQLIEHHDGDLSRLASIKGAIRSALAARSAMGFEAPESAEDWGHRWERHTVARGDDLPETFD